MNLNEIVIFQDFDVSWKFIMALQRTQCALVGTKTCQLAQERVSPHKPCKSAQKALQWARCALVGMKMRQWAQTVDSRHNGVLVDTNLVSGHKNVSVGTRV